MVLEVNILKMYLYYLIIITLGFSHGVGNFSENREYKKIIKSNIRSYGFLNNYLYYFDFLKIIYSFNRIRKKFKIINIRNFLPLKA